MKINEHKYMTMMYKINKNNIINENTMALELSFNAIANLLSFDLLNNVILEGKRLVKLKGVTPLDGRLLFAIGGALVVVVGALILNQINYNINL